MTFCNNAELIITAKTCTVHVYMYTHTYVYVYVCMYVYVCVHTHTYMHRTRDVYRHMCSSAAVDAYDDTCMCAWMRAPCVSYHRTRTYATVLRYVCVSIAHASALYYMMRAVTFDRPS